MRIRRFDAVELTVFVASLSMLIAIPLVGFALLFHGTPWWAVALSIVLDLVWLVRYERWYQRRHAPPASEVTDGPTAS